MRVYAPRMERHSLPQWSMYYERNGGSRPVKINGKWASPRRWPDGSYSVQGACDILGITPQTIFDWIKKGWLSGKQLAKGMPWQIFLTDEQAAELKARARHTTRSKREAP